MSESYKSTTNGAEKVEGGTDLNREELEKKLEEEIDKALESDDPIVSKREPLECLGAFPENFVFSDDFLLRLIRKIPIAFSRATEKQLSDKSFVTELLRIYADAVFYIHSDLKSDPELMLLALECNNEQYSKREDGDSPYNYSRPDIYRGVDAKLFNDKEFILRASKIDARIFRYISKELLADSDFCAEVKNNSYEDPLLFHGADFR